MPRRTHAIANDLASPRAAVLREIARRHATDPKWTRYKLATAMSDRLTPGSVYSFLRGNTETSSKHLEAMLKMLDLVIVPRDIANRAIQATATEIAQRTQAVADQVAAA